MKSMALARIAILSLVLGGVAGCASLVDDPCAQGFHFVDGACVIGGGDGDDDVGGSGSGSGSGDGSGSDDGGVRPGTLTPVTGTTTEQTPPEPLVCELPELRCDGECIDVSSDPDNCGACNRVCSSGICTAGHCEGELAGHIVAIGHDYQSHHAAMARVLGNSVALAGRHAIGVGRLRGTAAATATAGTTRALSQSLAAIGRPWTTIALPATPAIPADVDVLLVEAQLGDPQVAYATGLAWAAPIDTFLQRGGVVITLEGDAGTSYQLAKGANLYDVAAPVTSTNQHAIVVDPSDAVTQHVHSPYAAETTSVTFDVGDPVITTLDGAPVVFHRTRY